MTDTASSKTDPNFPNLSPSRTLEVPTGNQISTVQSMEEPLLEQVAAP